VPLALELPTDPIPGLGRSRAGYGAEQHDWSGFRLAAVDRLEPGKLLGAEIADEPAALEVDEVRGDEMNATGVEGVNSPGPGAGP